MALTSAASLLFDPPATSRAVLDWSQLPALKPDTADPQHAWLQAIGSEDPEERLKLLDGAPETTAEVWLEKALTALKGGYADLAKKHAASLLNEDPWEWRALWMDGLAAMKLEDWEGAKASFNAVYQQIPGELAPKLALAVACEQGGLPDVAEGLYTTCAETDAAYVAPASFGMARVRADRQDMRGAVDALDQVPKTSRGYPESRQLRAEVLLAGSGNDIAVLDVAMSSIESVPMDPTTRQQYVVRILQHALGIVQTGKGNPRADAKIGSYPASESGIREGLEKAYRGLARDAVDLQARVELVNQANGVRAWTLT
jgi:serine/threonine-protein kinase PknG